MTPENWLPVAGYEGLYEISDLGRIRSLARTVHRKNGRPLTVRQRILKPRQTGSSLGHLQVALYKPGGRKDCTVDRLVKLTFGDALAPSGAPVRSQTGGTTSPKTEALEANCALFFDAGLPVERFCHGGPDAEKWWALTERDELIELPD